MRRYSKNNLKIDKDGKRVYKTTYYPEIPLENSDEFIMVKDGTRIDNLAFQRYGDPSLWWIIAKANGIRDGSFGLKPDEKLRVPSNVPQIINDLQVINEDT